MDATPRRVRRGDIHSASSLSSPSLFRSNKNIPPSQFGHAVSDAPTPGSAPLLSQQAGPSEGPDDVVKVIWGTNVSLMESMATFTDFLRNFKAKYRRAHDREHGVAASFLLQAGPEEGERLVYEDYLRKMRRTMQTNLNLDAVNLLAYPPSRKLHSQLIKYPQEIIPIMDQVLKDVMVSLAEEDANNGMDDMIGEAADEEINDIIGRVYKVRPFGVETVNMRSLNPSGQLLLKVCPNHN